MEHLTFPNIDAPTTQGQVEEIKEYLFRLTNIYNHSISEIEEKLRNQEDNNGDIYKV